MLFIAIALNAIAEEKTPFRPASVPICAVDPYFSIWSPSDRLTDTETEHWTGRKHPLHLMVRIDGSPYRLMGAEPAEVPAMMQKNVIVTPISTNYWFENETISVNLIFATPMLFGDLDLMSRPVTYMLCGYHVKDSEEHEIQMYFDAGAEIAVNTTNQSVYRPVTEKMDNKKTMISVGTNTQNYLGMRGDDVRIDWGHLMLSVIDASTFFKLSAHDGRIARKEFARTGSIQTQLDARKDSYQVDESGMALTLLVDCETAKQFMFTALIAYDDLYSIRYFGEDLPAWWRRDGKSAVHMLEDAWAFLDSGELAKAFENIEPLIEEMQAVGGEDYAKLCALAYRHSLAAQKIVADANGMPLMFSKENNSNGSIGTVDLMYPCSPLLLYYSPALMKATLQPIFDYSNTPKWKFPFAPHDVGTYPHATGQTYGGGERSEENQMPVEESANMIIMTAALAVAENNTDYAKKHWKTLTKWADYLLDKGFDPENQLCTDDFAGHMAHNVNLSAKAIVAIGAYAQLAEKLGEKDTAQKYRKVAEEFVARWIKEADDGDHYRLAFDKPGSWSMKYNIFWDEILDLKLFPPEVMEKEIAYYKTKMNKYGLPLDNRSKYSKNDWILWTAAMTKNETDFKTFLDPVIAYVNDTPQRVPLSDWYYTDSARQVGFKARSVVGGFWAPMLKDTKKWQAQAAKGAVLPEGDWAEILLPGKPLKIIAPTAENEQMNWRYTFRTPAEGWEKADFDDSGWREGKAGFGTRNTPSVIIGTEWNSRDIWIRRSFDWDGEIPENGTLVLNMHHDDDAEVYLNGIKILSRTGWTTGYQVMNSPELQTALKKGKNTLAVHCYQDHGGQYIDVGIEAIETRKRK